jgi:lipid-A-disaccharide synthase-like uncharacterized protein
MLRSYLVVAETVFVTAILIVAYFMFRQTAPIPNAVRADIKLPDSRAQLFVQRNADGRFRYLVRHPGGITEEVTSDQLAGQLYRAGNSGWLSALGGSSPMVMFWLGIGLFGQLLFTGRMLVQWLVSEKKGTSVVPPIFWWMSLVGSLLLLTYFLWRRDPIGLLGQAFGSFVYLRNILWILEGRKVVPSAAAAPVEATQMR